METNDACRYTVAVAKDEYLRKLNSARYAVERIASVDTGNLSGTEDDVESISAPFADSVFASLPLTTDDVDETRELFAILYQTSFAKRMIERSQYAVRRLATANVHRTTGFAYDETMTELNRVLTKTNVLRGQAENRLRELVAVGIERKVLRRGDR